jgi:hypothetical protein
VNRTALVSPTIGGSPGAPMSGQMTSTETLWSVNLAPNDLFSGELHQRVGGELQQRVSVCVELHLHFLIPDVLRAGQSRLFQHGRRSCDLDQHVPGRSATEHVMDLQSLPDRCIGYVSLDVTCKQDRGDGFFVV